MKTSINDINAYGSTAEKALSSFSDNAANAAYILGVAKALRSEINNRIGTEIYEDGITFKEEMISRVNDLSKVNVCQIKPHEIISYKKKEASVNQGLLIC